MSADDFYKLCFEVMLWLSNNLHLSFGMVFLLLFCVLPTLTVLFFYATTVCMCVVKKAGLRRLLLIGATGLLLSIPFYAFVLLLLILMDVTTPMR